MKFIIVLTYLGVLYVASSAASEYFCSSPNDWFSLDPQKSKWPSAKIPYDLTPGLTIEDKSVVYDAFEEYHSKTCVRFVPKQDTDTVFTSIEANEDVCGSATVCMRDGYQYARFGKKCKTKQIMIHELGHNLCLTHEHQRSDRDQHLVSKGTCNDSWTKKDSASPPRNIYDYASQMHGACKESCLVPTNDKIQECGPEVTDGLSLLDIDYINELYSCGGCFRHRWVPVEKFTKDMEKDLSDFGRKFDENTTVYPCRGFMHDELSVGTFDLAKKICYVPLFGVENKLEGKDFEILLIPSGLEDSESKYRLVRATGKMNNDEMDAILTDAVPAISLPWTPQVSHHLGYIAYGNIDFKSSCGWGPSNAEWVGKALQFYGKFVTYFPVCSLETELPTVDILVCKPKLANLYPANALNNDPFQNWKLRHMEAIDSSVTESSLSIVGKRFPHSTDIYFLVSQQVTAGPIFLHLHLTFDSKPVLNINSLSKENLWSTGTQHKLSDQIWNPETNSFKIDILRTSNKFQISVNDNLVAYHTFSEVIEGDNTCFLRCYGDTKIDYVDIIYGNESQAVVDTEQPIVSIPKISNSSSFAEIQDEVDAPDKLKTHGASSLLKTGMYLLATVAVVLGIVGAVILYRRKKANQKDYMEMPVVFENF